MAEFTTQRDSLVDTAQDTRKNQVFSDYLATLMEKMKRDGKIKIYKEVLDQLREEEPQIEIPGQPRRPPTD
jgi:hypothetical protein